MHKMIVEDVIHHLKNGYSIVIIGEGGERLRFGGGDIFEKITSKQENDIRAKLITAKQCTEIDPSDEGSVIDELLLTAKKAAEIKRTLPIGIPVVPI